MIKVDDVQCRVFVCVADRGELHQVEVVGQNATLLQEIPLFTSHEPINNILLHKVGVHASMYYDFTHRVIHLQCRGISAPLLSVSVIVPCVSRARLWWAALCLWLVSRPKVALCIPTVRCAPGPEDWAVCGARRKKPAGAQRQSEHYKNTPF